MNAIKLEPENNRASTGSSKASTKEKSCLCNWITLTFSAVCSFVVANLLIGEIANMGIVSINYFCSGSLLVCTIYFLVTQEWAKKNNPADQDKPTVRKVLTRTWDNKFDCCAVFYCLLGAICQTAIFMSIMLCYRLCHSAGLNIGIGQAIWAINPFFVAVMERCSYGVSLKCFQVLGMLALVICAICVSLSELFSPKDETTEEAVEIIEITTPVHVAVLASFCMPISCCFFAFLVKYADKSLKLSAYDFTVAYWFLMSLIVQIVAIVYFKHEGFILKDWVRGSLASIFNMMGCGCLVLAFNSDGAPYGTITAVTQT